MTKTCVLNVCFVVLLLASSGVVGHAQSVQLQKLLASPPKRADFFAARVSVSGHVALVAAPGANFDLPSVTSGEAHVFRYGSDGTWVSDTILRPANRAGAVSFGMSASVNGDVAVVAGYKNNACTDKPLCIRGAAWVFRYDYTSQTWNEEQELAPIDSTTISLADWQEEIGPYVSVSGNVIVLGMHFDATRGANTGAAYIYRFDGAHWQQEQKLLAQAPASGAWFGIEVAVQGDVAVVGAFLDSPNLFLRSAVANAGSAEVFRYDGRQWNREQKLLAFWDGQAGDLFGTSLAISGDVIVVGAVDAHDKGPQSGAAYVFRYNKAWGAWFQQQKLTASDGKAEEEFGRSVAISGGVILVAGYRDNTLGYRSGSVYVFRDVGRQWVEQEKLNASDELPGDRFGRSVSLSGDIALICAYKSDDACPGEPDLESCDSGSAYLFDIRAPQP
jgi:hypothetical protein